MHTKIYQMKKFVILSIAIAFYTSNVHAQLVVKINNKAVSEGQLINADSIRKMEVSFSNLKKLQNYSQGKVVLLIDFINTENQAYIEYRTVKNGINSIDAFLQEINTPIDLFDDDGKAKDLEINVNLGEEDNFFKLIKEGKELEKNKKFKVKVSLYFKDKIGYEQYGDPVYLVKPVNFLVNNGL
jgi:hypothetical protein